MCCKITYNYYNKTSLKSYKMAQNILTKLMQDIIIIIIYSPKMRVHVHKNSCKHSCSGKTYQAHNSLLYNVHIESRLNNLIIILVRSVSLIMCCHFTWMMPLKTRRSAVSANIFERERRSGKDCLSQAER